jgi:molybdate transport system ATP-binding protein
MRGLVARIARAGGFALDVELRAEPGITVLFGPSGAGKTSLLHAVLGATRPDSGRVELGGRVVFDSEAGVDLPIHQRRIGIVFQDALLLPHLDARDNVAFGASGGDRDRNADHWLERVGAAGLAGRKPRDLSGGERQRVAFARALAAEPQALLLDEPFASLDHPSREALGSLLLDLRKDSPIPFVHVTHDPAEALRLGDSMAVLERGKIVATGSPVGLLAPGGSRSAGGSTNWLRGTVLEDGPEGARVDLGGTVVAVPALGRAPGSSVVLALPAEEPVLAICEVRGTSARNVILGTVVSIDGAEGAVDVVVATPVAIRVRITRAAVRELALAAGSRVWLLVKASAFRRSG